MGEKGTMPVAVAYWVIKAVDKVGGERPKWAPEPLAGALVQFTTVMYDERQKVEPDGFLLCDGRAYRRRDYPDLAPRCRKDTSWLRWHIGREFNVPDKPFTVGVDFA